MKITQAEARRLRAENKRFRQILNDQRSGWAKQWPAARCIGSFTIGQVEKSIIQTALALDHAVVITADSNTAYLHALQLEKVLDKQ